MSFLDRACPIAELQTSPVLVPVVAVFDVEKVALHILGRVPHIGSIHRRYEGNSRWFQDGSKFHLCPPTSRAWEDCGALLLSTARAAVQEPGELFGSTI